MGAGYDETQQVRRTVQQQQIQLDQHDQLPKALIAQQERERQEQMRREQRLVPETGVKAKTKRLFTGKKKEKAFGVTEEEVNDHFSEERSQAFIQELQRKVEEDMGKTYHKGFHKVLKKIGEYVKCVRAEASYDDQQSAFREVTDAIRDYQKRYPEPAEQPEQTNLDAAQTNLDAEQSKQLEQSEQSKLDAAYEMGRERINMYQLYFDTITNGSLQVPEGQEDRKIRYTEDAGKTLKAETGNTLDSLVSDYDASKECLFPHEPKVSDVWQRGLGDCYLLSGLVSLVKDHPSFIKQSMKDDGKGHVTVRFFKKGYDHAEELPETEKEMLEKSKGSDFQNMEPKTLILKLLTFMSGGITDDVKYVSKIYEDVKKRSETYFYNWKMRTAEEAVNAGKEELLAGIQKEYDKKLKTNPVPMFMNKMKALQLDNVPELCRLAERLAQNTEFVGTIVNAVNKEKKETNDALMALEKGYALLADSLLDSESPLHQEITNLSDKLDHLEEPEAVPVYVTVDKKVPRFMGMDYYSANSLWVSMIERAYAASGLHNRRLKEPESMRGKAKLKEILDKEKTKLKKQKDPKLSDEEIDHLVEKKRKTYMEEYHRTYNHSFRNIVGGHSSEFLEDFTGISRQDHITDDMFDDIHGNVSETWRVTEPMGSGICLALYQGNDEHREFIRFLDESIGNNFSRIQLKKLYDSRLNRVAVSDLVNHFCKLGNWVENLPEKMKQYQLDKKTLETMENKLREYLPQYIEDKIERGTLKVQYDPMSGRYTERAIQEYEAIETALRNHIPVGAGTVGFPGGAQTGLNGEPVSSGIIGRHAYAVVGVKEMDGKKFVRLRNPWRAGDTGYVKCTKPGENAVYKKVKYNSNPFSSVMEQKEQGTFYLELNDFVLNVDFIYFNSNQEVTA